MTQNSPVTTPSSGRISGAGRALVAVYGILALAATGRSFSQLARKFEEAPLAYSLSGIAAVVYILATVALVARGGVWRRVAWWAIGFELVGVLTVGILSIAVPELFQHSSVWSFFGRDYLFIPLVLPILGLLWLRRDTRAEAR